MCVLNELVRFRYGTATTLVKFFFETTGPYSQTMLVYFNSIQIIFVSNIASILIIVCVASNTHCKVKLVQSKQE